MPLPGSWATALAVALLLAAAAAPCASMPRATESGRVQVAGLAAPAGGALGGMAGLGGLRLRGGADAAAPARERVNPPPKMPMKIPKEAVYLSKSAAAIFVGLLTTSAVMVAFEFTAHKIAASLPEAATEAIAGLVVAGGLVGSLFGGWVLARLAPSHPMLLALLTGTLFTGAQYLDQSNRSPGSPEWYNLAGLVSFVPPYLLSAFLSNLAGLAPKRLISVKKSAASPSPKEGKTPARETPRKSSKSSKTPSKGSKTPKRKSS